MPLSDFFDKSATLKRQTGAVDAGGGIQSLPLVTIASAVPCAVWGVNSAISRAFARQDMVGDTLIATGSDIGAKAADVLTVGTTNYVVQGVYTFNNAAVSSETLVIHDTTLRR